MPLHAISLDDRALIAITGVDAAHFLNGLLTANIETLAIGKGVPCALLTPQGKMVSEMLVYNASDEEPLYLIDVGLGFSEMLISKLTQYILRARVSITPLGLDVGTTVVLGDAPMIEGEDFYTFADPRHEALGQRLYGPVDALAAATATLKTTAPPAYHLLRIRLGVPEAGKDYYPLDTFPHEVLLDQLGGVDFKKGCYIGQEVVSRMEHRGSARTRALPVRLENGFGVIDGVEIRAGDTLIGRIGQCLADRSIAILRLDKLEDALNAGIPVLAGGVPISVETPDFVRFKVPHKPLDAA